MKLKPGDKYGMLTALSFDRREDKNYWWLFRCDCGNEKVILSRSVLYGLTESCVRARILERGWSPEEVYDKPFKIIN